MTFDLALQMNHLFFKHKNSIFKSFSLGNNGLQDLLLLILSVGIVLAREWFRVYQVQVLLHLSIFILLLLHFLL